MGKKQWCAAIDPDKMMNCIMYQVYTYIDELHYVPSLYLYNCDKPTTLIPMKYDQKLGQLRETVKGALILPAFCIPHLVPRGRVELPLSCENRILSPARLPVPPSGHNLKRGL